MMDLLMESGLFIPEPPGEIELEQCAICKRTFVPATLNKHIGICQKMQTRKRAIFDSSQMRREGTELEKYLPPPPVTTTPAGLHKWLDSRVSPPKQTPKLSRKALGSKSPSSSQTLGRGRSDSTSSAGTIADYVRKRSVSKEPVSEQCPYCERSFGSRAYDRHVEWCKEKAVLKSYGAQQTKESVEKERLRARINYRAPSLKTKRGSTRDKYSPFDDVFMKNYVHNKNKSFSEAGRSLCNSMTSSVISDGGFSDKYDPFVSAKRQLDDLFSADLNEEVKDRSPAVQRSPLKPLTSTPLSKVKGQPEEGNFRRSLSLRLPKKTSTRQFIKATIKPSAVQSGITDDGPISSNFLKPEQYDEMPVRSSVQRTLLRSPDSIPNRRNIKLNPLEFPISKTDSLATFLNYEKNLGLATFSEKDMKDTSNILNKQSTMNSVAERDDFSDEEEEAAEEESPRNDQPSGVGHNEPIKSLVDYIDPKLINACDDLDTSASSTAPGLLHSSSSERKVQLKRQLKLDLDNILYDKTTAGMGSGEGTGCDEQISAGGGDEKLVPTTAKSPQLEKYFDDFDFEEFINSFEDDEQNPIFKGYKEMLRSNSKLDGGEDEEKETSYADSNKQDFEYKEHQQRPACKEFVSTDSSYGSLTRQSTPEKEPVQQSKRQSVKMSRFCFECGNEFMAQAKFCMECGMKRVALEDEE